MPCLSALVTEIDGFDIRFVHLRSRHSRAMPLVMPRGRPELVLELLKFIGPLTDPTLHGGQAEDAFDVVIPWMPGYGSSTRLTATCCDFDRTARTWHELMRRLGYERYVCRDSDSGVDRHQCGGGFVPDIGRAHEVAAKSAHRARGTDRFPRRL